MAEAASLFITLGADISAYVQSMNQAMSAMQSFAGSTSDVQNALDALDNGTHEAAEAMNEASEAAEGLGHSLAELVEAEAIIEVVKEGFEKLQEAIGEAFEAYTAMDKIAAQTAAGLQSTGGIAGVTAEQVGELADSIERHTGVSKEAVQSGENLLLTFTNIQNRVGAGNDVFNQATKAMTDLSVRMGGDTQSAALQLGKALNDPLQGMSALQRVGVSFSDGQKQMIATMEQAGDVMGAQKIILAELNKEFGGSADAFGTTMAGAAAKAKGALEDLERAIIGVSAPQLTLALNDLAAEMFDVADAIEHGGILAGIESAFGPGSTALVAGFAAALAGPVVAALASVASGFVGAIAGTDAVTVAQTALVSATEAATAAQAELDEMLAAETMAMGVLAEAQASATAATAALMDAQASMGAAMGALPDLIAAEAAAQQALADAQAEVALSSGVVADAQAALVESQAAVTAAAGVAADAELSFGEATGAAMAAALEAMLPVVALAGAVAFAAYPIIENWGYIKPAMEDLWHQAAQFVSDFVSNMEAEIGEAIHAVQGFAQSIAQFMQPALDLLSSLASLLPASVQGAVATAESYLGQLGGAAAGAMDVVKGAGQLAVDNFKTTWGGAFDDMNAMWTRYANAGTGAHKEIEESAKQAYSTMGGAAAAAKQKIDPITKALDSLNGKLAALSIESQALGWSDLEFDTKYAQALEQAITSLAEKGIGPADSRMKSLVDDLGVMNEAIQDATIQQEQLNASIKAFDDYGKEAQTVCDAWDKIQAAADGGANAVQVLTMEIKANEQELAWARERGIEPIGQSYQELADTIRGEKLDLVNATLADSLVDVANKAQVLGTSFDQNQADIQAYTKALSDLAALHITAGADVDKYTAALHNAQIQEALLGGVHKDATVVLAGLQGALNNLDQQMQLLGPEYVTHDQYVQALKQHLMELSTAHGVTAQQVQAVKNQIVAAQTPLENYTQATSQTQTALSNLTTGLQAMEKALGLSADPLTTAINNILQFSSGLAQVATGVQALPAAFADLSGIITGTVIPAITGLVAEITAATGGLNLIIAAIVAAAAAVVAFATNFDNFRDGVIDALQAIIQPFEGFFSFVADSFQNAIAYVGAFWDALHGDIHSPVLVDTSAQLLKLADSTDQLTASQVAATDAWQNQEAAMKSFASAMDSSLDSGLQSAIKGYLNGTQSLMDGLRNGVKSAIIDGIVQAIGAQGTLEAKFGNDFQQLAGDLATGQQSAASNIIQQISGELPSVVNSLTSQLQPLANALDGAFNGTSASTDLDAIIQTANAALDKQQFAATTLNAGGTNGVGSSSDLQAQIQIYQTAMESMREDQLTNTTQFAQYNQTLQGLVTQLAAVNSASGKGGASSSTVNPQVAAYSAQLNQIDQTIQSLPVGSPAYNTAMQEATTVQGQLDAAMKGTLVPAMASGGLVTGATLAMVGEGASHEAVLPLDDSVFSRIARGILGAAPAPAPATFAGLADPLAAAGHGGNTTMHVTLNYTGNGKWTRADAQGLLDVMTRELKAMGIRP